ncbi:uncharacterized protein HD556DRAFT_1438880 [Suillus plorans]|uniref:Uncharacterized protein n=1 Tax=Suillus plorans TaxID=116603 RepID=A0A9P7DR52_9AGAM|nr:uncharacterized protein HD556DRAFT_1438880 [Suillus plorans]KAG1800881.1 hypothetical protein HD556DRAFT_1438880 [Suillus plorans]
MLSQPTAWPSSSSFHYNSLHNNVLHSTWQLDSFSDLDFEPSSDSNSGPTPEDGTTLAHYNPAPAPAEILYMLDYEDDDVRTPVYVIDPCGFCGQSGHPVKLVKQKRTFQPQSSCPQAIVFSLSAAVNSSKASPSTNASIRYELCPTSSGDRAVFWKYNVHQEIEISRLEKECLGIPPDLIDNAGSEVHPQDDSNATATGSASSSQNSSVTRKRQTLQGNAGSKRSKKA